MDELPKQTFVEVAMISFVRKGVIAIIGGLSGLLLGITFSPILKIIYNYDWTTLGHEQPSYVIVSGCLGLLIGLLPYSVLKKINGIRNIRLSWAVAICITLLLIYFIIVHLVVRHLILDAV